jgi:putative nucleotidyltransferase with HDIG domain
MERKAAPPAARKVTPLDFELAHDFLNKFHVILKNARTYDRFNEAMRRPTRAALSVLDMILNRCENARFDIVGDTVFFDQVRLRTPISAQEVVKYIVESTKAREIRSVIFDETVEMEDLLAFADVFARVEQVEKDRFGEMMRLLELEGIAGIHLHKRKRGIDDFSKNGAHFATQPEDAKQSFFTALHVVREAVSGGISTGKVNPRRMKRVVESVVDNILSNEDSMLALTAILDYDEYTYHHSLNVCIYSIALGNRLGLPKQTLCEIGVAALFHDIGKTDIPRAVLNKTASLSNDEWEKIRMHTISGVRVLSQLKRLDRPTLRAILSAYCHHMNMDRSGYPSSNNSLQPDVISRIVRVADVYDALTTARSYRMRPFSTPEALKVIADKAGKELDPTLCGLFFDVVGYTSHRRKPAGVAEEVPAIR